MRKNILLAMLAASTIAVPATVSAQRLPATVVAVVDTGKIYSECTACAAARTQLQSQATALQARQKARAEYEAAQLELIESLTPRQEAVLMTLGVSPPATSTVPSFWSTALCILRLTTMLPVRLQVPVAGSYSSQLIVSPGR